MLGEPVWLMLTRLQIVTHVRLLYGAAASVLGPHWAPIACKGLLAVVEPDPLSGWRSYRFNVCAAGSCLPQPRGKTVQRMIPACHQQTCPAPSTHVIALHVTSTPPCILRIRA